MVKEPDNCEHQCRSDHCQSEIAPDTQCLFDRAARDQASLRLAKLTEGFGTSEIDVLESLNTKVRTLEDRVAEASTQLTTLLGKDTLETLQEERAKCAALLEENRPHQGGSSLGLRMAQRIVSAHGGLVSYKSNPDGSTSPYELNINYFDALNAPGTGEAVDVQVDRFATAHAILLALQGVPGIYFHSLFGMRGWPEGATATGRNRTINRQKFERYEIEAALMDEGSRQAQVFQRISHLLKGVEYQIPLRELRDGMRHTPHFDTLLVMEHLGGPEWSVDCADRALISSSTRDKHTGRPTIAISFP